MLSDYVTALLCTVKQGPTATSETQNMINQLVNTPLSSTKGQGIMVLLRCNDNSVATEIFSKLKSVRNLLGLQYRFEIILDDGESVLKVSDHFLKRLMAWRSCNINNDLGLSYESLNNLPCLVIMSSRIGSDVRLPRYYIIIVCHAVAVNSACMTLPIMEYLGMIF